MQPSAIHEQHIQELCESDSEVRVGGFRQAIKPMLGPWYASLKNHFGVIPDAYAVYDDANLVVVFEVEVGNRVDRGKMGSYALLADVLQDADWWLMLVLVDKYGGRKVVDPFIADLEQIVADAQKAKMSPRLAD